MSIASRIQAMEQHLTDDYSVLEVAGADLTNVDKNIVNLKLTWQERLLYFINNGTDVVWNNWEKVEGTGETLTLNSTEEAPMKINLKGNTSQETTTGKNLANYSNWEQGNFYVEGAGINGNVESANVIRMNDFINVKPSTTYTLSCNTTIGQFGYVFKDTNGNITGAFQNTGTKYYTFTTPSNVNQIRLRIGNSSYPKTYGNNYQIQLEENNQATPYEEYTGGQPSPSPDYPQNIHVVSGNNTIKVEGKNLCNGIIQNYFVNQAATRCGYAVGDSGLIIEVDGTSDYTISSNTAQTRYRVGCLNEIPVEGGSNTIVYNSSNKDGTNDSVTINTNGYKYLVVNATDLSAIQIEKGSSASEFQPYQSQTYEINLGNIELCKIGDYQDRIFKSSGKNLFDKDNAPTTKLYVDTTNNVLKTSANSFATYIEIQPNTTYTISKQVGEAFRVATTTNIPANNVSILSTTANHTGTNITITTEATAKYLYINYFNSGNTGTADEMKGTIQIEKGNSSSEYEPYGTSWYVNKQIGKVVLNGSESWLVQGSNANYYEYRINNGVEISGTNIQNEVKTNYFNQTTNSRVMINNAKTIYLRFPISSGIDISTLELFKTWLSTHNTTVYYVLVTPTTTEITNSTLISQLEALKKAISYDEQTNINQENNDLPFELEVGALKKY